MRNVLEKDGLTPDGLTVLFLGDSITDHGHYIAYLDAYFMHHHPESRLTFINLGVSSETVSGLSEPDHPFPRPCLHSRLNRALQESKPDWVVLAYGMNDAIYHPFAESRFEAYRTGLFEAIAKIRSIGAKAILMTPPPFDYGTLKKGQDTPPAEAEFRYSWKEPYPDYIEVLRHYKDWVLTLEGHADVEAVVNTFDPLLRDLERHRQQDPGYRYGDGIHPNERGHWIIAKTVLSRLFHIELERIPDFAAEANYPQWFEEVRNRHRLLSASWKEHVGHTNPNKAADALPLAEALSLASEAERTIRSSASREDVYGLSTTEWQGYRRIDFYISGREGLLITPEQPAPGAPWVWRTEFFGSFAQADLALLETGWHVAYFRLSHLYGCPQAVGLMERFREALVRQFGLAPQAALFGFSRGGLYAFNYAAHHPEGVASLYLDAPVLDINSWPGGKGTGKGSPACWRECLNVYGMTEEEAASSPEGPLQLAANVQAAGIPILIVAGDADDVVPLQENGDKLAELYTKLGGELTLIVKPGVGHHPHSLEDPAPIVDFVRRHSE